MLMLLNTIAVFLRKSKIFNKGRYSRTRQIVRGAFFFSLLLNIIVVFGALYMFYLYSISLTTIWWAFYMLCLAFVIPAALRRWPTKQTIKLLQIRKLNTFKLKKINYLTYLITFWGFSTLTK